MPLLLWGISALWTAAQSTTVPQLTEQVETGQVTLHDGHQLGYRIRLLPLASFPGIPDAVRAELEARSCMVPQTYEAKQPENVIHGAFQQKGSTDWAVLCSAKDASSLLVFFADRPHAPFTLASGKDSQWIAVTPGGQVRGFAWGIDAIGPAEISQQVHADPSAFDHDGVDDQFIERTSTIHYCCKSGGWVSFSTGN